MKETKLRKCRKAMKMKLREVAERIGVTVSTVHTMETNGILTPRAARKYAAAFPGTSWQDLLDINDTSPAGEQ